MCQFYRFDKLGFVDLISTNFYKVEVDCRLVFIIKLPIAAPKCLISDGDWRGNGLRSKTHEPVLFERSEFTGECAEQLNESRGLCAAARRCWGLGAQPIKRRAHIGFAQHGAKRLTFKRCLLAFLWAQFAFLLQAFSFSNKKKMPKRGIYISSG